MKRTLTVALATLLASCGTNASTPLSDQEPPAVLSASPDQGARGIGADVRLVLQFSEPMNKATTEQAYYSDSPGLQADQVSFSWDPAGRLLTITPRNDLAYGTATPRTYRYGLREGARDLAGNAIKASFVAEFSTLRRQTYALRTLPGSGGNLSASGELQVDPERLEVGDTAGNHEQRAFISFDLADLPKSGTVEWAELDLVAQGTVGDPQLLGQVEIEPVDYGSQLDQTDFDLPAKAEATALAQASQQLRSWLQDTLRRNKSEELEGKVVRSQYRLRIGSLSSDTDQQPDLWRFDADARLKVTLLFP
ncbi:hypothetical protein HNR42_000822 [Deinobacterium chartae]|uniref:SbsA Ig-like domain-containing protein n=1 Tax=Deinobacterium chartae TaxID=521158 RepID=A0A841HZI1_9DEIO|nr:Ig-like domain-containing protein [Deinobacterium chartae]MBB6097408.1 hypothetical protein [Deinobacterium chartae]